MYTPDEIDWKIIELLNEDGRMSSTEVSQQIGNISARAVINRINHLTGQGIINIRAIVDPERVGYSILADIYIEVDPKLVRQVAQQVAQFPEASYVACATGNADVSASLRARTIQELFDFVTDKIAQIPGVQRTQTHLLPLKLKAQDSWMPTHVVHKESP
jgi:DNA-binding Lrp family transcriptional regulator